METNRPLILVSNDDGVDAPGLQYLINIVREYGDVVVVAPEEGKSGMSHAISIRNPLRLNDFFKEDNVTVYSCPGTPVDCVKLALNQILDRTPDILVSGINHGSNSSVSLLYSGTMGAALEGCMNRIPSIGFSLLDHAHDADFTAAVHYGKMIFETVLEEGLPLGVCLNVNVPNIKLDEVKGVRVCRQAHGVWRESYDKRLDPRGTPYYWLSGEFKSYEPSELDDTDDWALENNYVAIVPVHADLTAHTAIDSLKHWDDVIKA